MSRRQLVAFLGVFGTILGGWAATSHAQSQTCQPGRAVILAVNSARTGTDVALGSGDVVVSQPYTPPTLGPGFSLFLENRNVGQGAIKADRIRVGNQSVFSGGAYFNQLTNNGLITGGQFTPLALPASTLPPFLEATFRGTPQNITVGVAQTRVLAPGEYGDITVATAGRITFTGGVYHIRSLEGLGNAVILAFNAASEVRIQNKFRTRSATVIGPAGGSGISAANIVFYVGGINGTTGALDATPEAARIGGSSAVNANFYVPNGTVRVESDGSFTGALIGRDVQVDARVALTRNNAFPNLAPKANGQDVVTNGAEALTITVSAADPEGSDMTFAIQGAGLQFPARGSLGSLVQAPTPFPGNPPGCNPDNTPGCVPPDPPRTSATVTYTPNSSANEQNSFSFSATDACGNTGVATVRINPPGDPTSPPVAQTVDATNVGVETPTDTPRSITLTAGAPPAASLTFSVESLPAHGTIKDGNGAAIGSVPYTLPSRIVNYAPTTGFTGLDTFLFRATGSVGGTDTASVVINVFTRPELAQNQNVTTSSNTPVEITLRGNAEGSGVAADQIVTLAETQAQLFAGSSVAGNVSDATADGLGDARDNLPGPAPVLVAAGVDVNLGALPSGSVSDPDNDATASSNGDPDPDLVSATVAAATDGINLLLQVRFKPGTFDPMLTGVQFVLDTDRNPATGQQGVDAGCVNDNGIIGAEYVVDAGGDLGATAVVSQYAGSCNAFVGAGSGTTAYVTDGMDLTVPRSVLGGTDGRVNFKVITYEQVGPGQFTGVLDYMPDVGFPPGQAQTGIQGVARVQIEWDVSTLPGADGIENAEVTLSTVRGTVDSLDTSFFVGTGEQDGVLLASDYQAPASQIPGVVMPVPVGSSPGDEATFVFDVTPEVKAARAAGRNFFSIQGRVNEALAGGGFQRGLQVRSSATGNISLGKEPKLQVVTAPIGQDLSFKITSLPANGTLTFGGVAVVLNQTFAFPPTLLYRPSPTFTGSDAFNFQVTRGSLSDLGTISILVNSLPNNCEINGRPAGC